MWSGWCVTSDHVNPTAITKFKAVQLKFGD